MRRELPLVMTAIAIALAGGGGCGREDQEVRSYRVPSEPVADLAATAAPDPAAAPGTSVPPPPPAAVGMLWDLPEGWRQVPNSSPMRFATLIAGDGDDALEVAITQLTGAAGGVAANINRWRGQVGLEAASPDVLARDARPIEARGATGVLVELVGPGTEAPASSRPPLAMLTAIFSTASETWFIKAMADAPAIARHHDGFVTLCESVRFSEPAALADATPHFEPASPAADAIPEGWTPDAPPKPMSIASFTVSGEGAPASMTVTALGGGQDSLANVNRWRRQLGLDPVPTLADQSPQPIEVGGTPGRPRTPGTLFDIAGDGQRTLAVIVPRGATTWFYKLSGPDALVADQKAAFEAFVRAVRFDGDGNG